MGLHRRVAGLLVLVAWWVYLYGLVVSYVFGWGQ